jgi:hypothetical protein
MKRFVWLLILAAAGYGVWKYYPELERQARSRTEAAEEAAQGREAAGGPASVPATFPDAAPAGGRPPGAPPSAVTVTPSTDDELAARFPLPEFKSLETLVGGWKKIPASAFPRQVTLKVPATLQLTGGTGSGVLEAGRKVYALAGMPDGSLVIAPSPDAVMRGQVPMEATDFQDVLQSVYDDFKKRKRTEVERLRASARREGAAGTRAGGGEAPAATVLAKIGPRPIARPDATVPAVVDSMAERQRSKKQAEPPPGSTLGWGGVHFREVDGEPYWAVGVRYTAHTIFGEFPTEALALMRHGRVVRWIYAGTGEPLP